MSFIPLLFNQTLIDNLLVVLSGAGGAIVVVFLREIFSKKDKEKILLDTSSDIEKDVQVYKKLSETLSIVECDRIGLYQLHNGESFLGTKNSFKKLSNTFEITAPGVSSEQMTLQNLPISIMSLELSTIKENKYLFIENVNTSTGINTGLFKMRNVISAYIAPIYSLSGNIMAYISAEWVLTTTEFEAEKLLKLQETAAIISGYLYKYIKKESRIWKS